MADAGDAAREFTLLARALRDAGATGLRKELNQAINDAVRPLGREIASADHLRPYLPNRYADTLAADMSIQVSKRTGADPGVRLQMKGRSKGRHVSRLNQGILTHPVFGRSAAELAARHHGRGWTWVSQKVTPGFFDDAVKENGPAVRAEIEKALKRVSDRIAASTRGR